MTVSDADIQAAFRTLGIPSSASLTDVKRAYRSLAKSSHPDLGGSAEDFKSISDSYNLLTSHLTQSSTTLTTVVHNMGPFRYKVVTVPSR